MSLGAAVFAQAFEESDGKDRATCPGDSYHYSQSKYSKVSFVLNSEQSEG